MKRLTEYKTRNYGKGLVGWIGLVFCLGLTDNQGGAIVGLYFWGGGLAILGMILLKPPM